MKKSTLFVISLLVIASMLLTACGANVVPAPVETTNVKTGEEIAPGNDAGGVTQIIPSVPNEENIKKLLACQMIVANNLNATVQEIVFPNGVSAPAKVTDCNNGDTGGGILVAASTITMEAADVTILLYVATAYGLYLMVRGLDEAGVIEEVARLIPSASTSYSEPASLPTFGALAAGTAAVYTSYAIPELISRAGTVSFTTYGALSSEVTQVYLTGNLNLLNTESPLLAMMSGAGQTIYATTTPISSEWVLPVADWYLLATYARLAAQDAVARPADFPEVQWPDWDSENSGWQHAAQSRKWPIMGIMLAYEAIMHTADHIYFSPTRMKILVTTYDPYMGIIGQIFTTGTIPIVGELIAGGQFSVTQITPQSPITLIMDGVKMEKLRFTGCYSVMVYPFPTTYDPKYDPAPIGTGRCLENGN